MISESKLHEINQLKNQSDELKELIRGLAENIRGNLRKYAPIEMRLSDNTQIYITSEGYIKLNDIWIDLTNLNHVETLFSILPDMLGYLHNKYKKEIEYCSKLKDYLDVLFLL